MIINKKSEKILLWLHREDETQKWLSEKLNCTRQAVSQKIKDNSFTPLDISIIKQLGCVFD